MLIIALFSTLLFLHSQTGAFFRFKCFEENVIPLSLLVVCDSNLMNFMKVVEVFVDLC